MCSDTAKPDPEALGTTELGLGKQGNIFKLSCLCMPELLILTKIKIKYGKIPSSVLYQNSSDLQH